MFELYANLFRGLGLHAHIDRGVGTGTRLNNGELRPKSRVLRLERADAVRDIITNRPSSTDYDGPVK